MKWNENKLYYFHKIALTPTSLYDIDSSIQNDRMEEREGWKKYDLKAHPENFLLENQLNRNI